MPENSISNVTTATIPKESVTRKINSPANLVTYSMNGLKPNTLYVVTIRTQNKWGWSPFSDVKSFHTLDKSIIMANDTVSGTVEMKYEAPDPLISKPETSLGAPCVSSSIHMLCMLIFIHAWLVVIR